jgi:hypothetical protein
MASGGSWEQVTLDVALLANLSLCSTREAEKLLCGSGLIVPNYALCTMRYFYGFCLVLLLSDQLIREVTSTLLLVYDLVLELRWE